ncbi:hypothetical protein PsYK624_029810 [Phanerochaete sordida]|uniref:F-box domain-containing protein n=1 Tax=Phanerochaete sordida TaxID=48140 RepID=A0A9P3G0T5_9APHY|nr:hypothetical protein PsYK624_029810 [Phanerochaete sordida]
MQCSRTGSASKRTDHLDKKHRTSGPSRISHLPDLTGLCRSVPLFTRTPIIASRNASPAIQKNQDSAPPGGASAASAATAQPASKVTVAKSSKPRRRRGKLAGLTELPIDVIIEVVMHLNPGDLLSLARTTKAFRDLLMRKSSAFLWKAARENLEDYPSCPEDMNEPGLASFLYTNYCSSCLKPNVKWIYWEVRARYCKACAAALDERLYRNLRLSTVVKEGVPFTATERNRGLQAFLPTFFLDEYQKEGSLPWITFEPDLTKLRNALTAEPGRYKEILDEHQQRMKRIRECLSEMRKWHAQKLVARELELKDIRHERYADIIERLRNDGWGEDVDRIMDLEHGLAKFRDLPCVKEPRPLTDRTWANVSDTLVQWLEVSRADMIEEERLRVSRARLQIFDRVLGSVSPYRPGEPSRVDVALGMPEIREVVERPPRELVTEESFAFLHDAFPAFRARWRKEADAYLGQLVRAATGSLREDIDPMQLAVAAAFRCASCKDVLVYPAVLSHNCRALTRERQAQLMSEADPYRHVVLDVFMLKSRYSTELIHWDPSVFKYIAEVKAIKRVVALAKLDYRTATRADMDESPMRFACLACYPRGEFDVLDWAKVYHEHGLWDRQMSYKQYKRWERDGREPYEAFACYTVALPEQHAETARTLECTATEQRSTGSPWSCGRCPYLKDSDRPDWHHSYDENQLKEHIRQKHHVPDPVPERDYFSTRPPKLCTTRPQVYLVSEALRNSEKPPLAREFEAKAAAYVKWVESDVIGDGGKPAGKPGIDSGKRSRDDDESDEGESDEEVSDEGDSDRESK